MVRAFLAEHPLCAECKRQGVTRAADEVDHLKPISDGGAMFDSNNLQSLCRPCHEAKTASENAIDVPGLAAWQAHNARENR